MTDLKSRGVANLLNGVDLRLVDPIILDTGEVWPVGDVEPSVVVADGVPHAASAIVARWMEIEATLAPIIGPGGTGALYKRSLRLTAKSHPWLQIAHERSGTFMDLSALHEVLSGQPSGVATVGGAALLQTFVEVLTSLVGPRLTDQLLGSRRSNPFRGLGASPGNSAR